MALRLDTVAITLHGKPLLRPFSLAIGPGEIVTLMGPSGSGKSSLLSFIAGDLDPPFAAQGRIALDHRDMENLPPHSRNIGRLFQDDLLFPHLSVGENLLFGMPRGKRPPRLQAMVEALRDAELEGFANRAPHTLSGGQRARAALMRALLARPAAMLLDEPFNKLDAELRGTMRRFVFERLQQRRIACLMVTHDRADAPDGGRVLRLSDGQVRDD